MVDVRQELLTAQRDAADEIAAAACAELFELPAYRDLPPGGEDDVRQFTSWMFDVFLSCLEENRRLSPAETARLAEVGRRRAESGIDVDDFTAAFEIVYDRSHASLVELADQMDDPTAIAVLSQLTHALGSLSRAAVLAVASGFDDVDEPSGDTRTRAANAILEVLTTGVADRALLTDTAAVLGITGDDAVEIVIAVPRNGQSADLRDLLARDGDSGLELLASTVQQRPRRHAVGLVAAPGDDTLQAALTSVGTGYILITKRLSSVGDLGTQYTEIQPYLHLAEHLADRDVLAIDNVRMYAALASSDLHSIEQFVRTQLGTVLVQEPDQAETMLTTIAAYLESGRSNKLTAERLHLHPKSVAARLRTIEQRTTVTLAPGVDTTLTLVAVQLYRTHSSDFPAIGDQAWGR